MIPLEKKESFQEIIISSLWVLIAWLIWSISIFLFSFFISNYLNIFEWVQNTNKIWVSISTPYPIILSLITLIWTTITSLITYKILWITNPEKYKKNNVIFSQVAFFQILVYIFILPVYVTFGAIKYDNVILTFIFHILIIIFGTNIILDILNNYRYVLIWIYGSFIWFFISIFFAIFIFNSFSSGNAKLISLLFLLPAINFLSIFIKKIFELIYFHFYNFTWIDPIWDIFYKIQKEDEENEKEEEQKNMI